LLLQSEVRITAALEITARSTHNLTYQAALETTLAMIKTGQPLSMTLTLYPKLFPVLFIVMIRAGETTGNLGNTLTYLSDLYEADIRDFTKNLTTVLEPLLMLLMGLCVGFVAISIITPIYGITQNLHP
jgi:type IV pilus assembly protein PilC